MKKTVRKMSDRSWLETFTFAALLTAAFLVVFSLITVTVGLVYGYSLLQRFSVAAGTQPSSLISTAISGWQKQPVATDGHKNILLLGLDTLPTRGEAPSLTDTMMVMSFNLQTGEFKAVSLPRDIWLPEYGTKINSLYYYGQQRQPERPEAFPTQEISEFVNVPIHHTIVVSLDQVAALIDLLGGIEVKATHSFRDEQFPRPDVDVTVERDPAKLYQTIEFQAGDQIMSGEQALQYIRSRHAPGTEGSDTARAHRQQEVISGLIGTIASRETLSNPELMAKLYRFYGANFEQYLSLTEIIATAHALLPVREKVSQLSFQGQGLSIYPEASDGVLWHPPLSATGNQWAYVVRDQSALQLEVRQHLGLSATTSTTVQP